MRDAPQSGFASAMVRTRSASSEPTCGRPIRPRRDFQLQKARKPCRCQRITVSGRTRWSASRHPGHQLESHTQKARSKRPNCGRFDRRRSKASCCRSARFSSVRSVRVLSAARRAPNRASTRDIALHGLHVAGPSSRLGIEFWQTTAPTYDPDVYAAIRREIEQRCPLILNFSTGGTGPMEGRVAHIAKVKPPLGALNMGSMNYAKYSPRRKEFVFDFVFENPFRDIAYLLAVMKEAGVKPELECFDIGHTNSVWPLLDQGLLKRPLQFSFIMGSWGGIRATTENLALQARETPKDSTWEVIGISHEQWRMLAAALSLGGNVRVGLEDNFYLDSAGKQMARSNGELVAKAVRMARDMGREPASVAQAREILSLDRVW